MAGMLQESRKFQSSFFKQKVINAKMESASRDRADPEQLY